MSVTWLDGIREARQRIKFIHELAMKLLLLSLDHLLVFIEDRLRNYLLLAHLRSS